MRHESEIFYRGNSPTKKCLVIQHGNAKPFSAPWTGISLRFTPAGVKSVMRTKPTDNSAKDGSLVHTFRPALPGTTTPVTVTSVATRAATPFA